MAETKRVGPGRRKKYVQDRVAKDLPVAMDALGKKLREGDLAVFKTLWHVSGLDKEDGSGAQRRGRSGGLMRRLLKRMDEFEQKKEQG